MRHEASGVQLIKAVHYFDARAFVAACSLPIVARRRRDVIDVGEWQKEQAELLADVESDCHARSPNPPGIRIATFSASDVLVSLLNAFEELM